MARKQLILDRYEVVGLAGSGGFGTVQIAWDRRIQRKVAIKTIQLTDRDARRAALPGADAVAVTEDANETAKEQAPAVSEESAPRTPPRAQTPAEARARREAETAQRAAEQEALSQAWEEPWVQVPQDVINTLSLDSLPVIDLEANKAQGAQEQKSRASSLVLPEVMGEEAVKADKPTGADDATEALDVIDEGATCVIPLAVDEAGLEDDEIVPDEAIDIFEQEDDEFSDEPDEALDPSELADADAPCEPDDDLVAPTTIIEEARRSLKDLSAFDAHSSWDGKHPWDDADDASDDDAPDRPGEDGHITALAHIPGLDEARTAAKLSDPRIVAVYDFEVRGQVAYLIMEYIEGITLTELLANYADYLTIDMVTGVFDAVAGALEIAHDAGVLHLDIKPDNIIINKDGQAKVTDFGLATLADASGGGFAGGGTIGYMPLEQMRRESLDARTDEWSLAAVAYEMLTGSNPFRARTLAEAESAIMEAELLLPSLCWPSLDSQLDDVIFYALDPNREERYASIEDFADEVDKFLGDAAAGEEQLALVVEDALMGQPEDAQADATALVQEDGGRRGPFGLFGRRDKNAEAGDTRLMPGQERDARLREDGGVLQGGSRGNKRGRRGGLFAPREDEHVVRDALAEKLDRFDPRESFDDLADEMGDVVERIPRAPLFQRVPEKLVEAGARVFSAGGSALVGAYALSNIEFLSVIPGGGSVLATLIAAAVFAALGAILPLYGALVAFCVLGISICLAGHPIVGAVLIVASALWWYVVGREGPAESNVALLGPLAGSIGGAAVTPLFAGAALKPLQAAITMVYCVLVACVFASLGSESLLGWDIFAHPSFLDTNITLAFGRMFTRPLTWTMAAGWIGGAVLFSLLNLGGRRWTFVAGLIVCVACVLAGTLVFTAPTPQLFISLIVGAAILLVVFV